MPRILPFVTLATTMLGMLAACAFPETRWEKDGTDAQTATNDLAYCRAAARNEAFVTYPFGYASPFYGYRRLPYWDNDRFYAEGRLTNFCMRAKGYQLVTVQPQPRTQPPAPPPTSDK